MHSHIHKVQVSSETTEERAKAKVNAREWTYQGHNSNPVSEVLSGMLVTYISSPGAQTISVIYLNSIPSKRLPVHNSCSGLNVSASFLTTFSIIKIANCVSFLESTLCMNWYGSFFRCCSEQHGRKIRTGKPCLEPQTRVNWDGNCCGRITVKTVKPRLWELRFFWMWSCWSGNNFCSSWLISLSI